MRDKNESKRAKERVSSSHSSMSLVSPADLLERKQIFSFSDSINLSHLSYPPPPVSTPDHTEHVQTYVLCVCEMQKLCVYHKG